MELKKLKVYQISRELSKNVWNVYKELGKEYRFLIGQQFLSAVDSIGANIAEGFGRYHYLDSVRFYYNARGSLWESKHWAELLMERELISNGKCSNIFGTTVHAAPLNRSKPIFQFFLISTMLKIVSM